MKPYCIVILLLCSLTGFGQKTKEPVDYGINNILRLGFTAQAPWGMRLNLGLEKKITHAFSVTPRIGLLGALRNDSVAFDTYEKRVLLAATADIDIRYYFNIQHRIKKGKTVENFSGTYVSLQPYINSRPFVDISNKESSQYYYEGSRGIYGNLGVQHQLPGSANAYIGAYIGYLITSKSFAKESYADPDPFHIGITLGFALNR